MHLEIAAIAANRARLSVESDDGGSDREWSTDTAGFVAEYTGPNGDMGRKYDACPEPKPTIPSWASEATSPRSRRIEALHGQSGNSWPRHSAYPCGSHRRPGPGRAVRTGGTGRWQLVQARPLSYIDRLLAYQPMPTLSLAVAAIDAGANTITWPT